MKIQTGLPLRVVASAVAVGILMTERNANGQPPGGPAVAAGNPSAEATSPTPTQQVPSEGVSSPAKRPFSSLSPQERDLVMDSLKNLDATSLFQAWLDAGRVDHDPVKQQATGNYLWAALRSQSTDPVVYDQMRSFIGDAGNPSIDRGHLLNVLGEAATREALDILIQTATTSPDPVCRGTATNGIKSAGALWGDGTFHEELAPALDRVWSATQDRLLLMSTAVAMAKVGAPSSIKLLVSSALPGEYQGGIRQRAAQEALHDVLNPHAVPVLAALLVDQPPTSATAWLASGTLAAMASKSAAKPLLQWLEGADATAAQLARTYVVQARNPASIKAFWAALDPSVPFRSEENREAIRSGLAQYDANRRFGP